MKQRGHHQLVVPQDYPELGLLVWNRDVTRPIPAREAFELYERNWRHVRVDALTDRERDLVADLADQFGHGLLLT